MVDVMAGEMLAQVRSVAKGLMAIGARPGTMVAIYSATSYEVGVIGFRMCQHWCGECSDL